MVIFLSPPSAVCPGLRRVVPTSPGPFFRIFWGSKIPEIFAFFCTFLGPQKLTFFGVRTNFRVSGQTRQNLDSGRFSGFWPDTYGSTWTAKKCHFGQKCHFCDFVDFCGFLRFSGNLQKSDVSDFFRTCPDMSKSCDSGHLKLLNFEVPKISTFGTFLDTSFEVSPCVI